MRVNPLRAGPDILEPRPVNIIRGGDGSAEHGNREYPDD